MIIKNITIANMIIALLEACIIFSFILFLLRYQVSKPKRIVSYDTILVKKSDRLGIYRLLDRRFKFFGNIRSYAIDFPSFHDYFNCVKTGNIIYPHFGPQPQPYSPPIVPVILYYLKGIYLIKSKLLGKNPVTKFNPKTAFINGRC